MIVSSGIKLVFPTDFKKKSKDIWNWFFWASRPKKADWSKSGNLGLTNQTPTTLMLGMQLKRTMYYLCFLWYFELWTHPPTFNEIVSIRSWLCHYLVHFQVYQFLGSLLYTLEKSSMVSTIQK